MVAIILSNEIKANVLFLYIIHVIIFKHPGRFSSHLFYIRDFPRAISLNMYSKLFFCCYVVRYTIALIHNKTYLRQAKPDQVFNRFK